MEALEVINATKSWWRRCRDRLPKRVVLCMMICLLRMCAFMLQFNASVAVLAMTQIEQNKSAFNGSKMCGQAGMRNSTWDFKTRMEWDSEQTALFLSAYFYGQVISSLPGGIMGHSEGGRILLGIVIILAGITNILIPIVMRLDTSLANPLRVLVGFFSGPVLPTIHAMISHWAVPQEKGTFTWVVVCGRNLGLALSWPLCTMILQQLGWEYVFYITGALAMPVAAVWITLVHDWPHNHPTITQDEIDYINKAQGSVVAKPGEQPKLSVFACLFSCRMIALILVYFADKWVIAFAIVLGPSFLSRAIGYDYVQNVWLSASSYIGAIVIGLLFVLLFDFIVYKKKIITKKYARKCFVVFSHIIPGILILVVGYLGCHSKKNILLIIIALQFNSAKVTTTEVNVHDLAPNFTGILYAILQVFGSIPGIGISALLNSLMAKYPDETVWKIIFACSGGLFTSTGIIYLICGSANIQYWNFGEEIVVYNLAPGNVDMDGKTQEQTPEDRTKKQTPDEGTTTDVAKPTKGKKRKRPVSETAAT